MNPAWFKKGSGTFVRSTLRAAGAKVPDPFLNHTMNPYGFFFDFNVYHGKVATLLLYKNILARLTMTADLSGSPAKATLPEVGRVVPLSLPRRWICDLLHFAKQVPTVPVERRIDVRAVIDVRARLEKRPSWAAIFTRAYGLVAREVPELRRYFMSFPRPHLYEFPYSVASVAIERIWNGEKAVFFAHLRSPETQTVDSLDRFLRDFKENEWKSSVCFAGALQIAKYPRLLRRFVWWYGLNVSGKKRGKRLGTFGVSVYSGLGSESLHPLSPLTTTLNWGVIENGSVVVRIVYDHRVMDGSTVARAAASGWRKCSISKSPRK